MPAALRPTASSAPCTSPSTATSSPSSAAATSSTPPSASRSEWLSARRCRDLEPGLSTSCAGGLLPSEEAAVDPRALVAALALALRAAGGELIEGAEAVGLELEGGAVRGLRTRDDRLLEADAVVVAAGCWSGALDWLPEEARPPVRPVKGEILTLRGRPPSRCASGSSPESASMPCRAGTAAW